MFCLANFSLLNFRFLVAHVSGVNYDDIDFDIGSPHLLRYSLQGCSSAKGQMRFIADWDAATVHHRTDLVITGTQNYERSDEPQ